MRRKSKSELLKQRRMTLLKSLMEKAGGRHDVALSMHAVAPTLEIGSFAGRRFVDIQNPVYEGGSDLAYDFNTLREEGLIEPAYLEWRRDNCGGVVATHPGLKVTFAGLQAVEEAGKGWFRKSIEKQPMTFLQILVTIAIAAITFVGGWALGRYVTPLATELHKPLMVPDTASTPLKETTSGNGA